MPAAPSPEAAAGIAAAAIEALQTPDALATVAADLDARRPMGTGLEVGWARYKTVEVVHRVSSCTGPRTPTPCKAGGCSTACGARSTRCPPATRRGWRFGEALRASERVRRPAGRARRPLRRAGAAAGGEVPEPTCAPSPSTRPSRTRGTAPAGRSCSARWTTATAGSRAAGSRARRSRPCAPRRHRPGLVVVARAASAPTSAAGCASHRTAARRGRRRPSSTSTSRTSSCPPRRRPARAAGHRPGPVRAAAATRAPSRAGAGRRRPPGPRASTRSPRHQRAGRPQHRRRRPGARRRRHLRARAGAPGTFRPLGRCRARTSASCRARGGPAPVPARRRDGRAANDAGRGRAHRGDRRHPDLPAGLAAADHRLGGRQLPGAWPSQGRTCLAASHTGWACCARSRRRRPAWTGRAWTRVWRCATPAASRPLTAVVASPDARW